MEIWRYEQLIQSCGNLNLKENLFISGEEGANFLFPTYLGIRRQKILINGTQISVETDESTVERMCFNMCEEPRVEGREITTN